MIRKHGETFLFTDTKGNRHLLRAIRYIRPEGEASEWRCKFCFFENKMNNNPETARDDKCWREKVIKLTGTCDERVDGIRELIYYKHIKSKPPK